MAPHILYGAPVSLYTGKARSYLRTRGIDFVEVSPGSARYTDVIIPTVGRWIIPVLETPDGAIIQDTVDIIDHFERAGSRAPIYPDTPVHLAISHVFEQFGGEGLLRAAMHYRWDFDEHNLAFLESEFTSGLFPPDLPPDEQPRLFAHSSGRMRKAAVNFGISDSSIPLIEDSFIEWLDRFSAHLADHPYLLGNRPTLGDYGLMGPMWAHLYRDPAPTDLIKRHAPRVGRWVERMSTTEPAHSEYHRSVGDDSLIADDAVPETLRALLAFVAEEYLPELVAHVEHANRWLGERPELEPGTNGKDDPASRHIGHTTFTWRGVEIETSVMPYRFWLMQRLHDAVESFDDTGQRHVRELFDETGLGPWLDLRTRRRVERVNHLEVWGPVVTDG